MSAYPQQEWILMCLFIFGFEQMAAGSAFWPTECSFIRTNCSCGELSQISDAPSELLLGKLSTPLSLPGHSQVSQCGVSSIQLSSHGGLFCFVLREGRWRPLPSLFPVLLGSIWKEDSQEGPTLLCPYLWPVWLRVYLDGKDIERVLEPQCMSALIRGT